MNCVKRNSAQRSARRVGASNVIPQKLYGFIKLSDSGKMFLPIKLVA